MKITMDTQPTLYTKENAIAVAKALNESDDWTYVVVHDPNGIGYSFIEVYDEDNILVGKM